MSFIGRLSQNPVSYRYSSGSSAGAKTVTRHLCGDHGVKQSLRILGCIHFLNSIFSHRSDGIFLSKRYPRNDPSNTHNTVRCHYVSSRKGDKPMNPEVDEQGERVRARRIVMEDKIQPLILKEIQNPTKTVIPPELFQPTPRTTKEQRHAALMAEINSPAFQHELNNISANAAKAGL
jgi:hypothetical protein